MLKIVGKVEKGLGEARKTGFPTLNISYVVPKAIDFQAGVYAAEISMDGQSYHAAACVGADWGAGSAPKLEVYLFDAKEVGSWNGQAVEVRLLKKIRDLVRFADFEDARTRITQDVAEIKIYFQG